MFLKKLCTFDRTGEADDCKACYDDCAKECAICAIQECFTKLGAYENTGLSPEQIIEMDQLYAEKCQELSEAKTEYAKLLAAGLSKPTIM